MASASPPPRIAIHPQPACVTALLAPAAPAMAQVQRQQQNSDRGRSGGRASGAGPGQRERQRRRASKAVHCRLHRCAPHRILRRFCIPWLLLPRCPAAAAAASSPVPGYRARHRPHPGPRVRAVRLPALPFCVLTLFRERTGHGTLAFCCSLLAAPLLVPCLPCVSQTQANRLYRPVDCKAIGGNRLEIPHNAIQHITVQV
jgi:hypothetical protein